MNDPNIFIRNTIPSFVMLTEYIIIVAVGCLPIIIFDPSALDFLLPKIEAASIENVLIVVLISGGFGYLLNTMHHYLYAKCKKYPKTDHSIFLELLILHKRLKLRDNENKTIELNSLEKGDTWFIINSLWHQLSAEKKELLKMNKPVDRLSNTLHGAGASFVATNIAIILSLISIIYILKFNESCSYEYFIPMLIAVILSFLFWQLHKGSYKRIIRSIRNLVEIALNEAIGSEYILRIPALQKNDSEK